MIDKTKEEERLREEKQKQVEEAERREREKRFEEENLNEQRKLEEQKVMQEELKKQFEVVVEDDLDATLPNPDQKEVAEDNDSRNRSLSEEDKNWHGVVLASPDVMKFPDQAIKEFLDILLNPLTPESTKKDLLMKYSFSHHRPLPRDIQRLECTIERNKKGTKRLYPCYRLLVGNDNSFILAAQKMNAFGSAHYVITLNLEEINSMKRFNNLGKKTGGYLGKLRSNAQGTEYSLFGPGENPDKKLSAEETRGQFAGVLYVS